MSNTLAKSSALPGIALMLAIATGLARAQAVPCFPGEVKLFAGDRVPLAWIAADGQLLPIEKYRTLFRTIGTRFGGDGSRTFALPNLADSAPLDHTHYLICSEGASFASSNAHFVGEVLLYAGAQPPVQWELAQGQLLEINRSGVPFVIIGTTFGGDGDSTFGVPNLASQSPLRGVNYIIAESGQWPADRIPSYLGETTLMTGKMFPESEMMSAAGQLLRISQHSRLFAVIGLSFGGNGSSDFGLPDLIGYSPDPDLNYLITYNGEFPDTREDALP